MSSSSSSFDCELWNSRPEEAADDSTKSKTTHLIPFGLHSMDIVRGQSSRKHGGWPASSRLQLPLPAAGLMYSPNHSMRDNDIRCSFLAVGMILSRHGDVNQVTVVLLFPETSYVGCQCQELVSA